jgi:hypothetical protein
MGDAVRKLRRAQQRIAVSRRSQHELGPHAPAGAARPIVDHHLLPERGPGLLGGEAAQQIGGAAGGQRHHHGDGTGGIAALRLCQVGCQVPCKAARSSEKHADGGAPTNGPTHPRAHASNPGASFRVGFIACLLLLMVL